MVKRLVLNSKYLLMFPPYALQISEIIEVTIISAKCVNVGNMSIKYVVNNVTYNIMWLMLCWVMRLKKPPLQILWFTLNSLNGCTTPSGRVQNTSSGCAVHWTQTSLGWKNAVFSQSNIFDWRKRCLSSDYSDCFFISTIFCILLV